MNLYLYGHGFMLKPGPKGEAAGQTVHPGFAYAPTQFQVPADFTIHLYVDEGTLFDSKSEAIVKGLAPRDDGFRNAALLEPPLEIHAGATCDNLILTRPGAMKTLVAPDQVKEITVGGDAHDCAIAGPIADGDHFAIKKGGKPGSGRPIPNGEDTLNVYTYLSSIVAAIKGSIPNERNVHIHWLCCRASDLFLDEDGAVFADAMTQARDVWSKLN